jgi:N-ethylmaleimide reductase
MPNQPLLTHVTLGRHVLKNRIAFPPLTRQRSLQPGNIPSDLMATYYQQRASAGFMITEGTQIEPRGQGYAWTPGIYTPEQVEGWRKITDAVHAEEGVIFAQLWHVGRVSHHALQPDGEAPVAPSAIAAANAKAFIETAPGAGQLVVPPVPRALSVEEIRELVELYAQAAKNAIEAGFDGVEIHAANGYLVNQFISEHSNHREDEYGGSLENRLRFMREIVLRRCLPARMKSGFTSAWWKAIPITPTWKPSKSWRTRAWPMSPSPKPTGTMPPSCRRPSAGPFARASAGASSTPVDTRQSVAIA